MGQQQMEVLAERLTNDAQLRSEFQRDTEAAAARLVEQKPNSRRQGHMSLFTKLWIRRSLVAEMRPSMLGRSFRSGVRRTMPEVTSFASHGPHQAFTLTKVARVAVVMLAASVASGLLGAPAASAAPVFSQMHFPVSGKCADEPGWSTVSGTPLDQWACYNQSNEMWTPVTLWPGTFMIQNQWSGLCMNINQDSMANNAAVIQYQCDQRSNERFTWTPMNYGHRMLKVQSSGKCLNVSNSGPGNQDLNDGAKLIQYDCLPWAANEWVDVVWP